MRPSVSSRSHCTSGRRRLRRHHWRCALPCECQQQEGYRHQPVRRRDQRKNQSLVCSLFELTVGSSLPTPSICPIRSEKKSPFRGIINLIFHSLASRAALRCAATSARRCSRAVTRSSCVFGKLGINFSPSSI